MNFLVQIESVPTIPDADVVAALAAEGIAADVVGSGSCLEVAVHDAEGIAELQRLVAAALDSIVREQDRSVVAERLGPLSFRIHPVAA